MMKMKWSIVPIIGCLSWSLASGTILFSDDFSNPGATNLNWVTPFSTITRTCANGEYTLANSANDAAFVTTTLTPKQSNLTVSTKLTRSSESITAGILICFNTETAAGYLLQLNPNKGIQLTKYTGSNQTILFVDQSVAVVSGTNELKISKKNDSISLFCNGTIVTALRDAAPVAAGDAGFLVPAKQSAIFDDFVVTDEWIPPPPPIACFRDDFSVTTTTWLDYGQKHQKEVSEGYLKLTTTAQGAYADPYIKVAQFGVDTFIAVSAFSHRSGDSSNMYGIFLCGAPIQQGSSLVVPMAYFGINANRQFDAYIDVIKPAISNRIRGAAFQGTYYTDTIKVVKKRNTDYLMYVNGYLVDTLAASKVTFAIISAGINVDNRMVIWSDFFQFGPGEICPVVARARLTRSFSPVRFTPYQSNYLFDPMGRIIRTRSSTWQGIRTLVPGLYIMPGGKNGVVVK
jgi:hypothetical protein